MGGLIILLALCAVMAVASFLAGAIPLSMSLSQSQLRLLSSIGVGILVGTSLIVIIPEGIEAVAATSLPSHSHNARHLHSPRSSTIHWVRHANVWAGGDESSRLENRDMFHVDVQGIEKRDNWVIPRVESRQDDQNKPGEHPGEQPGGHGDTGSTPSESRLPTFYIGFSLTLGFLLMFLIDRLPRHATDQFQPVPTTRHISLDNLGSSANAGDEESEGFLGSLAPTPKQSRSLATTTGLVIHAAADGIAMGASATTANMTLGLIIFVAIMVHKAPAAFGLTSVLLKQGLSKRAARGHLIVFSLAAPVGALVTYLIISVLGGANMEGESGQWWTGMLLLFSAGTFLYVAMHAMQEEHNPPAHEHHSSGNGYAENGAAAQKRQGKPQMRDTIATMIGILLPLLTQFGHHH